MPGAQKPVVTATEIGEHIRHRSCERRFRLGFDKRKLARRLPFHERLFNPMDLVLQQVGRRAEDDWERSLREGEGFTSLNDLIQPEHESNPTWPELASALSDISDGCPAYAREIRVSGEIGAFTVEGRVDFVVVLWRDGRPRIRLVECKASRRDRTYHRVQVGLYLLLARAWISEHGLAIADHDVHADDVECVVARIDESTNEGQAILQLRPLDLSLILADVGQMLDDGGPLTRILSTELDDLPYKLEPKCDGCVFSTDCLPESARLRRLELIGLDPSDVRVMSSAGVETIDDLAEIDLDSDAARQISAAPDFSGALKLAKARAVARRRTLPGGDANPDEHEVTALPDSWASQLPSHNQGSGPLVRVYLCVDYDYTENRVGALSAHVTRSEGTLHAGFQEVDGKWQPVPELTERFADADADAGDEGPVSGQDVIKLKTSPWSGLLDQDNGAEQELIQGFLHELVDAIGEAAQASEAPIHFYVWSRTEMAQLIEGCTRGGSRLLAHLKELLGCREHLEQLIFSCVGEEVRNRYGLGWTSSGLCVAASLKWYGQRYHWRRRVQGGEVDLDRVFEQDLFDFKTTLRLNSQGGWSRRPSASRYRFEVRSRCFDTLPAPYWHAAWGTLSDPANSGMDPTTKRLVERYSEAARPGRLRAYLGARCHALRWIEERIKFKSEEIEKPPLDIASLQRFSLGIETAAEAALDFMQLEQHSRMASWISSHLVAPATRVALGKTLPVSDIEVPEANRLIARIDLGALDIDLGGLEERWTAQEFVRLSPCSPDPEKPQTVNQLQRPGSTCIIDAIDWDDGVVSLSVLSMRHADRYRLMSISRREGEDVFDHATLDESPSDFVSFRVDRRLVAMPQAPTYRWFDPERPRLPERAQLDDGVRHQLADTLGSIDLGWGRALAPDQARAVVEGLDTTVQLLQGPPGTGKTQTTAVAALFRAAVSGFRRGAIILVAAPTHTAVDNLLIRIAEIEAAVAAAAGDAGINMPSFALAKVHSSDPKEHLAPHAEDWSATACANDMKRARRSGVAIVGGTTSALLKMVEKLESSAAFRGSGFKADLLIVDEASMMVFPHFLALTTLVHESAAIMVTGDHRQLSPILAHDWEREDRPPTVLYQPFVSAYEAARRLTGHPAVTGASVRCTPLESTFRLPPLVRDLIAPVYEPDDISLTGTKPQPQLHAPATDDQFAPLWGGTGLYLVVHDERRSRKSNPAEAGIIREILEAGQPGPGSVAVITPHRAQRTLLRKELEHLGEAISTIDTVERLQGGQRPTVIISATASDPAAIAANVEFILDLNRSNVAFSRVQERLIVVCAETLLSHIAVELDQYESAFLWKFLRGICGNTLMSLDVADATVTVWSPDAEVVHDEPV